MRNPWSFSGEGKSRVKSDSESPEESSMLDTAFVLNERYTKEQEVFIRIKKLRYRFRIHFGNEKTKPFDDLNSAVGDMMNSAFMLGTFYWKNQGTKQWNSKEEFDTHLREMSKHQAIFWRKLDNDEFSDRISKIVQAIESACSKKIELR